MTKSTLSLGLLGLLLSSCWLDENQPPVRLDPLDLPGYAGYQDFFDPATDHHLTVKMTESEWAGMTQDMKDLQPVDGSMRTENLRRATLEYSGSLGTVVLSDIGVRTRGNTTRSLPEDGGVVNKPHFQLDFNAPFDLPAGSPDWQDRTDRKFFRMSGLALKKANGNDPSGDQWGPDASLIREAFSYTRLNAWGAYAPKATVGTLEFVLLNADGSLSRKLYLGPYTLIEPVNTSFLTNRFGKYDNDGNLYKCLWQNGGPASLNPPGGGWADSNILGQENFATNYHPTYDFRKSERDPQHNNLKNLVSALDTLSGADLQAWLVNHFDTDSFLRYLAGNVVLGMPDDYWGMGNNYYLYFSGATGRGYFFPYDYDHSLGAGWNPFDTAAVNPLAWHDVNFDLNPGSGPLAKPLVTKLLALPDLAARYKYYLRQFSGASGWSEALSLTKFLDFYDKVVNRLSQTRPGSTKTWLEGITTSSNPADPTLTIVPQVGAYLGTYMTTKANAVETAVPDGVPLLSSSAWSTVSGLDNGYVAAVLPATGSAAWTVKLESSDPVQSVTWSWCVDSAGAGGALTWTALDTDTSPVLPLNKTLTLPADYAEGGIHLKASVTYAGGTVDRIMPVAVRHSATERTRRSGNDVVFVLDPAAPWNQSRLAGQTIAEVKLVGVHNSWVKTAANTDNFVLSNGVWRLTKTIAAGTAYKIFVSFSGGGERWLTDLTVTGQIPNGTGVPEAYNSLIP